MSKLRIESRFGVAPHALLYDPNISLKAKGLYTYMQAKPDGWDFSADRIALENKEAKRAIAAGLRELEQNGYLIRRKRSENGTWVWDHVLVVFSKENAECCFASTQNAATQNAALQNSTTNKERDTKKELEINTHSTGEQSSREIASVIDTFSVVNQGNKQWYKNTTQRGACQRLVETYGMELVLKVIGLLKQSNGRPYFPTITTPVQLEQKWAQLEAAFQRYKQETTNINVVW